MHRGWSAGLWLVVLAAAGVLLAGCSADRPLNPSFSVTVGEAQGLLREMRAERVEFERPVVVLSGWMDLGFGISWLQRELRRYTPDREGVIAPPYFSVSRWDSKRARVIEAVERAYPSDDDEWTVEVDVIGISMGGLVARYCALECEHGGKRLRIRNLYTIATPHRGAARAVWPTTDARVRAMRRGSDFLQMLDDGYDGSYGVYGYVRLGDVTVGPANSAPPGGRLWWVQNRPFEWSHADVHRDPRIVADLVRRLRGEEPLSEEPVAELPE